MSETSVLRLRTVQGPRMRFEADFQGGTVAMDSGPDCTAPNPVQHLLASIAACEAMDVISLLRKKRQAVTAYEVLMSGERAETHPRRFTSIRYVHRITGHGVQRGAVEESLRLAVEKYCSVYHCLRPDLAITNEIEIVEAVAQR